MGSTRNSSSSKTVNASSLPSTGKTSRQVASGSLRSSKNQNSLFLFSVNCLTLWRICLVVVLKLARQDRHWIRRFARLPFFQSFELTKRQVKTVRVRLVVRLAGLSSHLVQHFVERSDRFGRFAQLRRHLLRRNLDNHRLVLIFHFVLNIFLVL